MVSKTLRLEQKPAFLGVSSFCLRQTRPSFFSFAVVLALFQSNAKSFLLPVQGQSPPQAHAEPVARSCNGSRGKPKESRHFLSLVRCLSRSYPLLSLAFIFALSLPFSLADQRPVSLTVLSRCIAHTQGQIRSDYTWLRAHHSPTPSTPRASSGLLW